MGKTIAEDILGIRSRASINQKQKGNKNERAAAAWLAAWTGVEFSRVPSSGGLRWKNTQGITGDVICTEPDFFFPFSIETKFLKYLHLKFTLPKKSSVRTLWKQAVNDAYRSKKLPLMMLRDNGMKKGHYWIFFDAEVTATIELTGRGAVVEGGDFFGFYSIDLGLWEYFAEKVKELYISKQNKKP